MKGCAPPNWLMFSYPPLNWLTSPFYQGKSTHLQPKKLRWVFVPHSARGLTFCAHISQRNLTHFAPLDLGSKIRFQWMGANTKFN